MVRLFPLPAPLARDPAVDAWFVARPDAFGALARRWYGELRACGDDVRELLHDGQPTACVGGAAFGYVNAFKSHVNVGFFVGSALPDPSNLLEGNGKFMRHVKVRPGRDVDPVALRALILASYELVRSEVAARRA